MAVASPLATEYDVLLDLVKRRASTRKLKPDPIPDGYIEKILETARWAMSGANSQPWEFIVVRDAQIKKDLWRAYVGLKERASNFAMARVAGRADIYPVFRKLFARQSRQGAGS